MCYYVSMASLNNSQSTDNKNKSHDSHLSKVAIYFEYNRKINEERARLQK